MNDLQYAEARGALEAAIKRPGNDRETLLKIYELQGIVYATLNDAAKAGKAFQTLCVMDPERKLSGDYPPRVMTPFYEARGRAGDLGKLELKALPAATGNGRVGQLAVELASDPLKLVKKVKFHVRQDGGAWVELPADPSGKSFSVGVDAVKVEWWADGIGDRDAVFAQVGSEAQPKVDTASGAPVATKDPSLAPPPPPAEEERIVTSKSSGGGLSAGRLAGIAMIAGGAVAAGVGAVFGVMANQAKAKIDSAELDGMNRVIGITQREAYQLDSQVRTNATLANVLFVAGGLLAAGGVVVFLAGGSSSSGSVSLAPAGSGVVLTGSF